MLITDEGDFKQTEKSKLDEVTIEIYEAKVRDLMEKLERYKSKCDVLTKENDALGKAQAKASHDKQDIVEFLNIKVGEHEKHISDLEEKVVQMDQEKKDLEAKAKAGVEQAVGAAHKEIEGLQSQVAVYKAQLHDLNTFAARKDELEQQLKSLKTQLEAKERSYKETIHNIERKVLQDKNSVKKEMLQKVNEAVASFRRVADQQMAETTKRAIRENMAITSQLKKMSAKTIELIAENDSLKQKVAQLRTGNGLLTESEQELAKKNQTNQRVIKMLVEKLKESDKMLEMAYESGLLDLEGNVIYDREQYEYGDREEESTDQIYESERSSDADLPIDENLRARNSQLSSLLMKVCRVADDMTEYWDDHRLHNQDVISTDFGTYIERLRTTLVETVTAINQEGLADINSTSVATDSFAETHNDQSGRSEEIVTDRVLSQEIAPLESQAARQAPAEPRRTPEPVNAHSLPRKLPPAGLQAVIAAIPSTQKENLQSSSSDHEAHRDVAVQTAPLPFGPNTKSEYLLGEVRQWGPPAHSLPRKGLGLYVARRNGSPPPPLVSENDTLRHMGPPLRS
ncbi:hypothetical protein SpCBS45565_g03453 [Spizellomyces sp. 'palustris']|nr:hypothetical protein SpCBS45565_g03453 [Spizellomyces sp. 'palustris']